MTPPPIWVAVLAVGGFLVAGIYLVEVLDGLFASVVARAPTRVGDLLLRPVRRTARSLLGRRARTERPDAQAWALAPALLAALGALALAVVPLARGTAAADTAAGFVLFAAAISFVMVAVYLHGWAPNSVFPLIGGYRFVIEALSYQMPLLLALLATAIPARSLAIGEIIRAQGSLWNVVRQPAGLPLYLVVAAGASFWGPLNLSDSPDLAGGTSSETSGVARLLWAAARSAVMVAVAAMGAAAFLGGWWGPWLPGPVWTILKTLSLLTLLVASRHALARVRVESFVVVAWAVLIPLALANVMVSAVLLL